MAKSLHIAITSILFDMKPEGICTGRLVRALLAQGHRITLLTSTKQDSDFEHPNLRKIVISHKMRDPRWFFKVLARFQADIYSNFYLWSRRAAKFDFGEDVPDVFYGRAWPHASLVPAYHLAERYKKPLILHFSDPFQVPPGDQYSPSRFYTDLQRMVDAADAITFTNEETIHYQKKYLTFENAKAFVLNHVAPEPMVFGEPENKHHFYYVGVVNAERPATPLLQGFALHIKDYPDSRLTFVGSLEKYLAPDVDALGLKGYVDILPFSRDVKDVFRKAGVLVSIDALIDQPIYTPTKVVEYMMTDRPVLALTPPNSPVSRLLARASETALAVTDYSPKAIAEGLATIIRDDWRAEKFAARMACMQDFSAASVAEKFEQIVDPLFV